MKDEKGMRSAEMPQEHFEKRYEHVDSADMQYCSEFGAPQELKERADKLASYVEKNREHYG